MNNRLTPRSVPATALTCPGAIPLSSCSGTRQLITLTGKPRLTVYWTELNGLPFPLAEQLKQGRKPWAWPPEKRSEQPGSRPPPKK